MRTVVCKIGGSLFDLPDLAPRLTALLSALPDCRPLIVAGGGAAAEVVRRWSDVYRLDEPRAHRLAMRSLVLNEALLCDLLPGARPAGTRAEADSVWQSGGVPVLSAEQYLAREESQPGTPGLPHTWNVTSDSIAAWVAATWPAELLLVKSAGLPECATVEDAAGRGLVDAHFPQIAPRVARIVWVNLRSGQPSVLRWM